MPNAWRRLTEPARPATRSLDAAGPPMSLLVRIDLSDHPADGENPPFNRIAFTFTPGFPAYQIQLTDQLVADPSGEPIPLPGKGVVVLTFKPAQAHTPDGTRSTVESQSDADTGFDRMVGYAQVGDYEGVVTYGVGITWPGDQPEPPAAVRTEETALVGNDGRSLCVVSLDIDAS
jgi:hypothetical protein